MKFALVFLTLAALVSATPIEVDERGVAGVADAIEPAARDVPELEAKSPAPAEAEYQNLAARRSFMGTANPPTGVTLKCRTGASTHTSVRTTFSKGTPIKIKCQMAGENINGNNIWNHIDRSWARDCYVSDTYTKTGYKWIPGVPRC